MGGARRPELRRRTGQSRRLVGDAQSPEKDRPVAAGRYILHVLNAEKDRTLAGVAGFLSPKRKVATTPAAIMTAPHLVGAGLHPVIGSTARELLNKSDNERCAVLSIPMSFLERRDPRRLAGLAAFLIRPRGLERNAHRRPSDRRFAPGRAIGLCAPGGSSRPDLSY